MVRKGFILSFTSKSHLLREVKAETEGRYLKAELLAIACSGTSNQGTDLEPGKIAKTVDGWLRLPQQAHARLASFRRPGPLTKTIK